MKTIALISDFGTNDPYVGILHGVARRIHPRIETLDLCHGIPAFSPLPAAFVLEQGLAFFPPRTVFVVVVDPGVGSRRRILLAEKDGCVCIGPDNGVLTPVLVDSPRRVASLDRPDFFLVHTATRGASTFDARDKMVPAAAYLCLGVSPEAMSSPVQDPVTLEGYRPLRRGADIVGQVVYEDRFGNLISNIPGRGLKPPFRVTVAGRKISGHVEVYAQGGRDPFTLVGSHGNLEIAVKEGSAAKALKAGIGSPVRVSPLGS